MRALAIVSVLVATVGAQAPTPSPAPTPAPASTPAPAASATPRPPENFTYSPDGRRDPFQTLIGSGTDARGVVRKGGEGPPGMNVAEISVTGIMDSRGALVAMIQGPDKKTYIVRQGDKFADGTIKAVTPQGLIVTQEVNDPLSLVKQREIRKVLRSLEDAKE